MKSIEQLAREAGFLTYHGEAWLEIRTPHDRVCTVELERFASLVRAEALEEAAALADFQATISPGDWHAACICVALDIRSAQAVTSKARVPNANEVICPACTHQFRVISLTVQYELAQLVQFREEAKRPIDMVLYCPRCMLQHIDAPEPTQRWTNPPHRTHLCHGCGFKWRPADVPTNGVEAINLFGHDDDAIYPAVSRARAVLALVELVRAKEAHEHACAEWGRKNPPRPMHEIDPDGLGLRTAPAPEIDEAVARLNRAWDAAIRAV